MRRLPLGLVVAVLALPLGCGSAVAAGGQPDPRFGSGGSVTPEIALAAISRAADGTLLVTGSGTVNGIDPNNQLPYQWGTFGLQWLGEDGSGQRTVVSQDGLPFGEAIAATATATDSAGRVWIAGGTVGDGYSEGQEVVVERRLADGTLDPSFGNGGVARVSAGLPDTINAVVALLVEPDGRAVVVTKTDRVFRLSPDGALDGAFGIVDPGALALTDGFLDGDGRIVVAGQFEDPSDAERDPAGLAILDAGGHPGPRFTLPGRHGVMAAALAPGGQAILAGDSEVKTADPRTDAVNWAERISLATGAPDPSFGDHGSFTHTFGTRIQSEGYYEFVHDLAVGRDGAAILGGQYRKVVDDHGNAEGRGFLVRLTPAGQLDTSFGEGGLAPSGAESSAVTTVALDAAGRALSAGNGLHRATAATAEDAAWPDPVVALAGPSGGGG
ncbi:MAG: hlyA 4, partial [Conexibacter sp.]|nr:hlyA 4 [Conexibacter sp.]